MGRLQAAGRRVALGLGLGLAIVPRVASADDAEAALAELGLGSAFDDELTIYGFADFGYTRWFTPRSSPSASVVHKESSFYGASIHLYVTRQLSPRWRSMLELRVSYGPAGGVLDDGTYATAMAPDPASAGRPLQWGGIGIERAHLEYEVSPALIVQTGTFLTPYGIWNVDHGAPAIVPAMRPYLIGEDLFPEHQTGVHVYGRVPFGDYVAGYHATVSNGRGPLDQFHDLDENKALGGRLELHAPWLGDFDAGLSGYAGRYTTRPADYLGLDADGELVTITPPGTSYDEVAGGIDVRVMHGPLLIQAEGLVNHRRYRDGQRGKASTGDELPDSTYFGAYVLAGYRIRALDGVMPYLQAEFDRPFVDPAQGRNIRVYNLIPGLNYRPIPTVVLKLQVGKEGGFGTGFTSDVTLRWIDARVTWVF